MSIFGGLIGGAGEGLSGIANNYIKREGEENLERVRSDAAMQREAALLRLKQEMAEAPFNRLRAKAQGYASEDRPVEAAAVNSLSGAGVASPDGTPLIGLKGDVDALRKQAQAMPDSSPDKAAILAQIDKQVATDRSANQAAVAGKTRKRTGSEAFDAALEDALVNDPMAYAAGKPLASEKTITIPDGATVIDRHGKVIFSGAGVKDEREAKREDRRDERQRASDVSRDDRAAASDVARDARAAASLASAEERARLREDGKEQRSMNKALPGAAAKALLENQSNLRNAQQALALASGENVGKATGDKEATGYKGYLPNGALNRIDPAGVETRAAIGDIGSMIIHDRSGAAVTASEFPRLRPFVPAATDDAMTVKKKLGLFVQNYQAIADDMTEFYRESGYKVPTEVLKSGAQTARPQSPALPVNDLEAEMRRRGLLK